LAISWDAGFRGAARSAGDAVWTINVFGKWRSSSFRKAARATGGRRRIAVLLSD